MSLLLTLNSLLWLVLALLWSTKDTGNTTVKCALLALALWNLSTLFSH